MVIVWDERKRLGNIDKHGIDFVELDEAFFLAATIVSAREPRFVAIGQATVGIVSVVFRRLGREGISIISA